MEIMKNYAIEFFCIIAGIILLIVGFINGTDIVLFNLDGFYFFIAGLLIAIYGIGSAFTKIKDFKKNKKVDPS